MLKFRIASAERREGNYLLTLILGATAPTGSHRYGAGEAVLSPALAFGKGWRRLDVQSTFGANLPAGDAARLGRQLVRNTAFQYEAEWKLWPELEVNSTFNETRPRAGGKQVLLTPGLGFGRVRVGGRFRFSSAAGMQIAATQFHTYNHRWIFRSDSRSEGKQLVACTSGSLFTRPKSLFREISRISRRYLFLSDTRYTASA